MEIAPLFIFSCGTRAGNAAGKSAVLVARRKSFGGVPVGFLPELAAPDAQAYFAPHLQGFGFELSADSMEHDFAFVHFAIVGIYYIAADPLADFVR